MPVIDTLANIQQIQSRLDSLFAASAPRIVEPASAARFAEALDIAGASAASGVNVTLPQGSNATGASLATAASRYVGVPYVFGGEDESGMDCSGLVQRAFADLGISVPRLVRDQEKLGIEVPSLAQAQPGDLVVSAGGDHIGIWMGNNKIIHAPYEGRTVSIVENYLDPSDVVTIRRVLPQNTSLAGLSSAGGAGGTDLIAAAQAAALRGGRV